MCVLANRASVQEAQHYDVSLTRSAEATTREIELYIGGLQRILGAFAVEQQALLSDVIAQPQQIEKLREKVALHFPEHLAFAVSDPHITSLGISEPELFGESCRANLSFHSQNEGSLEPVLFLHDSDVENSHHFDVMATIPGIGESHSEGIVFVSFRVTDLIRLLAAGSSSTHTLLLENRHDAERAGAIFLIGESGVTSVSDDKGQQLPADYHIDIAGTSWVLLGFVNTAGATHVRNAVLMQAGLGLMALLIAGITAWRSILQERVSRNRTAIVLDSVELERKRIARELHDQVLSDVSHAKRLLMDLDDTENNQLSEVKQSIENFSSGIRTAINDLYPHTLENLGLCKALESYIQALCSASVNGQLKCDKVVDRLLTAEQKLHTYRIVAELITNVLKHATGDAFLVSIQQVKQTVVLCFEDNGNSFDGGSVSRSGKYGLNNIDSRVLALGATSRWFGSRFELIIHLEKHGHY